MNLKVIVAVVGVVALATLGVGVLMTGGLGGADAPGGTDTGAQPGDDADSASTPTPTPSPASTDTATPIPDEPTSEATATATATDPATPTATPRPLNVDEDRIAEHIARYANDERRSRDLDAFDHTGLTARKIAVMADNHSVSMAETDETVHRIDNDTTANRYQQHDLYETCKYKSQRTGDIVKPDEDFEALGKTTVEAHVGENETKYDVTEDELARTLFDKWMNSILYDDRLFQPETQRMGVGVEVTDSGEVYATANVCN